MPYHIPKIKNILSALHYHLSVMESKNTPPYVTHIITLIKTHIENTQYWNNP